MKMLLKNRLNSLPELKFNKDFNSLFNDFWNLPGNTTGPGAGDYRPAFEVVENKDNYEIHAELPGVDIKDVNVTLENNILTIKGKKHSEIEKEEKNYHVTERKYGSFERSFEVPEGIDEGKIKAELKKGILTLTIGKAEKARVKAKQITIDQG